jgi:hypothetical protein
MVQAEQNLPTVEDATELPPVDPNESTGSVDLQSSQLQEQIDTLLNLADLISTRIATAKTMKIETSRLVNARGWTLELAKTLGSTEDYNFVAEKQPRQLISAVINGEIGILFEMVKFIEQIAPAFQEAINEYNQPFIEKIKSLRELGEKTKEDQQETYSQMIVLMYPYFQMICQNLMETKFQYESK